MNKIILATLVVAFFSVLCVWDYEDDPVHEGVIITVDGSEVVEEESSVSENPIFVDLEGLDSLVSSLINREKHIRRRVVDDTYSDEDIYWLGLMMFYEAQGEGVQGRKLVADVTLNRTLHPFWKGRTVKSVVSDGREYQWVSNLSLKKGRVYDPEGKHKAIHEQAVEIMSSFRNGTWRSDLGDVIYFSTEVDPNPGVTIQVAKVGGHKFYRQVSRFEYWSHVRTSKACQWIEQYPDSGVTLSKRARTHCGK